MTGRYAFWRDFTKNQKKNRGDKCCDWKTGRTEEPQKNCRECDRKCDIYDFVADKEHVEQFFLALKKFASSRCPFVAFFAQKMNAEFIKS